MDRFDIDFDKVPGNIKKNPGDDPKAPYFKEHLFTTIVERMVAAEIGVEWADYDGNTGGDAILKRKV